MTLAHLRVRLAQFIARAFEPLCPGVCRQRPSQCTCASVPRLPDELNDR